MALAAACRVRSVTVAYRSRVTVIAGVAEHVGDDLDRDAGVEGVSGGAVSEVVQSDRWEGGVADQAVEQAGDIGRVQGGAVGVGEYQPGFGPCFACRVALGLLGAAVVSQGCGHRSGQGDGAVSGFGLWRALDGFGADAQELAMDVSLACVQVEVLPAQAADLTAAHAGVRQRYEQRVQPVSCGVLQEASGLGRGPDHQPRWTSSGLLPYGDRAGVHSSGRARRGAGSLTSLAALLVTSSRRTASDRADRNTARVHCTVDAPTGRRKPGIVATCARAARAVVASCARHAAFARSSAACRAALAAETLCAAAEIWANAARTCAGRSSSSRTWPSVGIRCCSIRLA
ncbi:hypothetical protein ABIA35_003093 [Catenulispora sp. MAP12-49]